MVHTKGGFLNIYLGGLDLTLSTFIIYTNISVHTDFRKISFIVLLPKYIFSLSM